ncbi:MAG: carbohydrate ABC transporter permease [Proteobacteria bacterium]|nr:carbohydrate ABC transporter permease [Pseudomonadota bacterium]MDC0060387.1 carbohydrate ABC transporter permease [Pelagibacteraceae bacterium]|tara:strand:- start:2190 stop:3077 length:888 start_codon:yes stop_codon:yes gene_type:complete
MVKKYNISASDLIIYSSLLLGVFLVIWPLLNLLAWALTPTNKVHLLDGLDIFPKGFDIDVFKLMLSNPRVLISFTNSIYITSIGLCLNIFFTSIAAYALSKNYLPGRNIILTIIIFTMVFEPSIVTEFLVVKKIGLFDSYWSIILYKMVNVYYLILMIRFFKELPDAYFEAAEIDGANHFQTFYYIVLPLSVPAMMVIGLFYTVAHWNEYFHAMIYLNDTSKWPLQVLLREFAIVGDRGSMVSYQNILEWGDATQIDIRRMRATIIFITLFPILLLFPLILKYFTKGINLGGIKE